jgi:phenylacetate-coenzyme A ligase PaaK-like adenylate-forming protein
MGQDVDLRTGAPTWFKVLLLKVYLLNIQLNATCQVRFRAAAWGCAADIRQFEFGAEPWSEPMRRDLEARLGIKAVDVYGLSEIIGPGVASECNVGFPGLAPYYQIVLRRDGALDAMIVEVERRPDTPDDAAFGASAEVQRRLKSLVGVTCSVVVKAPGEVPRSQGKAVRVRDERKN